jgi:hypothetical protein
MSSCLINYAYAEPTVSPKDPNLIGRAKSVQTFDENNVLRKMVEYNKRGDITLIATYDSKGNLYEKEIFEYDSEGIKNKYESISNSLSWVSLYNKKGNEIERVYGKTYFKGPKKHDYKYDENGNLIDIFAYQNDGQIYEHTKYIYKNGMKIEMIRKRISTSKTQKIVYNYDSKGNNTEIINHGWDGYLFSIKKYEYDDNGKKTKMEEHSYYKGQPRGKDIHVYDDRGNMIEERNITSDGTLMGKREYSYNKSNNIITEKGYKGNELSVVWKYSYNNKGNLEEFIQYLGPEDKGIIDQHNKYEYLFDKEGNWIERTLKNKSLLKPETWIRSIKYWN